jgi:hypothetical protein
MKKVLSILAAIALLAGVSAASTLVDKFDDYALGNVDTVTGGKWVSSPTGTTMVIAAHPTETNNRVLNVQNNGAQSGVYGILPAGAVFTNNTTKTLFAKFYIAGTAHDTSFGLTSNATPNAFGNFNVQCALINGTFRARNGGALGTATRAITANTWYYVWMVVNNTANTYSVYLKSVLAPATSADLFAADYAFRTVSGTLNPDGNLIRFLAFGNFGSSGGVSYSTTPIYFDDITVFDGVNLGLPPTGAAFNPSPENGATGVALSPTLSWNTGLDMNNPEQHNAAITHHYLYLRADANFVGMTTPTATIAASGPTASYSPAQLLPDKTYYWRVDEALNNAPPTGDPNFILKGGVWSFATVLSAPVVTSDPNIVFVDETSAGNEPDAVFEVTYTTYPPVFARWFKVVNGVSVPLTNDFGMPLNPTKYAIENDMLTKTKLTVRKAGLADQAQYYCKLVNTDTLEDVSRSASLIVKRLVAHYEFEDNYIDLISGAAGVGKNYPDANLPGPTFVPGKVGNAASFAAGNYVDLTAAAFPKAGTGNGMEAGTISMWVKPTVIGTLMANFNNNVDHDNDPATPTVGTTGFGFSLDSATQPRMVVRGQGNTIGVYQEIGTVQGGSKNLVTSGDWHHVATTWQTGSYSDRDHVAVYVDGVQVARMRGGMPDRFLDWERGVLLGAARTMADRSIPSVGFAGLMDNVKVFNYPKTTYEMAELYSEVSGVGACINTTLYTAAYDFNNNCKIDIGDFAILAANWLDCGLYPVESCGH